MGGGGVVYIDAAISRLFKTSAQQWVEVRPRRRENTKKSHPFRIGIRSKATNPLYRKGVWGIGNTKGGGYQPPL